MEIAVQAIDDLEGQVPGLVAGLMGLPHAAVVSEVHATPGGSIRFRQEYAGGAMADFEARPPVVLGVQAARNPPRYVSVARVRQTMKSASLEEIPAEATEASVRLVRLYRPTAAGRAQMIEGGVDQVAERIVALLAEHKLLRS